MAKEIKTKQSFGTVTVNRFSPERKDGWPTAINMYLSFEQALKLQLGLQHALLELNKLNRSTTSGRLAGVNLCLYTDVMALTINRGQIRED